MNSMTGYGHAETASHAAGADWAAVDIRSVNNRFLDIHVAVPPALAALEQRLREYIASRCARGRIDVQIRYRSARPPGLRVDDAVVRSAVVALRRIRSIAQSLSDDEQPLGPGVLKDQAPIQLEHLLAIDGVLQVDNDNVVDSDHLWTTIEAPLATAWAAVQEARGLEGDAVERDLWAQLARIEAALADIDNRRHDHERHAAMVVRERFAAVVGDQVEESRVLTEIAALLVRHSIHEEVQRLAGHVTAFRATLTAGGPCGKRLDFLCQEIQREANTLGAKSAIMQVSSAGLQIKEAAENLREQLRNVE